MGIAAVLLKLLPDVFMVVRFNDHPTFLLVDNGYLIVVNILVLSTKVGVKQVMIFIYAGQIIVVCYLNSDGVSIMGS